MLWFARSYSNRSLKAIYAEHEGRKNREYKERILKVEQADFTPLVFSLTGGMGPQAQAVVRRLGDLLAERQNVSKSVMMGWLRARLSFTILRVVITCLRGCWSLKVEACVGKAELAVREARIARERAGDVSTGFLIPNPANFAGSESRERSKADTSLPKIAGMSRMRMTSSSGCICSDSPHQKPPLCLQPVHKH